MTEKDLQLVTDDGDEVKMDLLFRMMHENLQESHEWMKSDVPTPTYSKPARSTTTLREDPGKPKFARKIAKNTVKIPFKDVKKVMGAKEDPKKPDKVFWPFKGISLPFLPNMIDYECQGTCCQALKVQGNLFVPCGTNVPVDRELGDDAVDYGFPVCSTCRNQSSVEKYGSLGDRLAQYENGDFYTAPKVPEDLRNLKEGDGDEKKSRNIEQKKEISFGTFMAKKGDLGTDAKQRPALLQEKIDEISEFFADQFGLPLDLPEHQLLIDGGKVRAKKPKSSSDDESSVSSAESSKKRVVKPKKAAAEVSVESDDDVSVSSESSAKSQKAQKKAEEKAKKLAEKEEKAQRKAEEKAKKLAEKEAKKAEKEAKKLEKAQKKAEKEAKKQEKTKKRSASIDSTDSEPSENLPQETVEPVVEKAVEKAVEPEEEEEEDEEVEEVENLECAPSDQELQPEESEDESDDDEAEYKNFKFKGMSYWVDEDNVVFSDKNGEPGEYVGDLNDEGKIEFKEE